MPIPRRNHEEFFIKSIHDLYFDNDNNIAEIYVPEFYDSLEYTQLIDEMSVIMLFYLILGSNNNIKLFLTDMMRILTNTCNNSNTSHILRNNEQSFKRCLLNFVLTKNNNNIADLVFDWYLDIPLNNTIQNLLGHELAENFRTNVLDYYCCVLLMKQNKKEYTMAMKKIYEQFKDYKIHRHYYKKNVTIQKKNKLCIKKYSTNEYKNRKNKCIHLII